MKYLVELSVVLSLAAIASGYNISAQAQTETTELLDRIEQYNQTAKQSSINQITNVNQLKDVSPTDWSYEAIRSLAERYNCVSGFPDSTFQGDRPITRYEFAAGMNACFEQIERYILE